VADARHHDQEATMKPMLVVSAAAILIGAAAPANAEWRGTRNVKTSDYCKPYNGPYGYYGNPYCEGGFDRDGAAGGYEIDLTRYFDDRYWRDRRDHRRAR
jgi:hypothetical protein